MLIELAEPEVLLFQRLQIPTYSFYRSLCCIKKVAEPVRLRYFKVRKCRLFMGKSKKLAEPTIYDVRCIYKVIFHNMFRSIGDVE